jgi:hypothetical protein
LQLLAVFAPIVALVVAIRSWYVGRWDRRWMLTACTFVLFVIWLQLDPGGLINWWAD